MNVPDPNDGDWADVLRDMETKIANEKQRRVEAEARVPETVLVPFHEAVAREMATPDGRRLFRTDKYRVVGPLRNGTYAVTAKDDPFWRSWLTPDMRIEVRRG